MIYCLILEDEEAAQRVLQNYIDRTPFISCIGVYESGLDIPIEQLRRASLLFLDIQLPQISGLSFLKTIQHPPTVIITSAFAHYAVQAFEEAVTDYLLKPFSYERFFSAVSRVRAHLIQSGRYDSRDLFVYADKTIHRLLIDHILYLKAEVDYVRIVRSDDTLLILDSLRNWAQKLSAFRFIRVHRSYVVNLRVIDKVVQNEIHIGSTRIPIGKSYRTALLRAIGQINL